MATPKKITAGKKLKIEFGIIDNSVKVIMASDSAAGGYAEPFSFNSAGMGSPNPDCEVDLTDLVNMYRAQKLKSVYLMVVGTNYIGGGHINFEIEADNGATKEAVTVNLATFTSQQWAYQIIL